MRKSPTRIMPEAPVSAADKRSQQVLRLATTEPDLLRDLVREALSQLAQEERRGVHNALISTISRAGVNVGHHLLVLGIPATTTEELTAPEIATLIRYIRISEPAVMKTLAPILIEVPGLHDAPAQRVKATRRAA
jgi:hypothetical protein